MQAFQILLLINLLISVDGGFELKPNSLSTITNNIVYTFPEVPADMEFIPGSTFRAYTTNGQDTTSLQITVMDFFMARHEETNYQYRNYIIFLQKYSPDDIPSALPDSNLWRSFLPLDYFSNPLYNNYPVIGLSIKQIEKYLTWKSNRLNEYMLVSNGLVRRSEILKVPYAQETGNYTDDDIKEILLPKFRLPSFYEWHYARRVAYKLNNEREIGKDLENELNKAKSAYPGSKKISNFRIFTTDTWFMPLPDESVQDFPFAKLGDETPNPMGICYNNKYYGEWLKDNSLKGRYTAGGVVQDSIEDPRLIAYRFVDDSKPGLFSFRCSMIILAK